MLVTLCMNLGFPNVTLPITGSVVTYHVGKVSVTTKGK